jgi:hypothetical protein
MRYIDFKQFIISHEDVADGLDDISVIICYRFNHLANSFALFSADEFRFS